jgi:hypothetical protein
MDTRGAKFSFNPILMVSSKFDSGGSIRLAFALAGVANSIILVRPI